MISYAATTEQVTITVRPLYLDEPSNVLSQKFKFGYHVHIGNHGNEEVQIIRNYWYVHDTRGRTQENEQPEEFSRQPIIPPGDSHQYGGYCVIRTFEGTLEGSFLLERSDGKRFRAHVPLVALRALSN
jgi:ApaG protein